MSPSRARWQRSARLVSALSKFGVGHRAAVVGERLARRTWLDFANSGHEAGVVAITVDAGYLFSASRDSTVRQWSLEVSACVRTFHGHTKEVTCLRVAATPHGVRLFTGSVDTTALAFDVEGSPVSQAAPALAFLGHTDVVRCLEVAGGCLFTGSDDATARQWGLGGEGCLRVFSGASSTVSHLVMASGRLVTASGDCGVRLWDTATGDCLSAHSDHNQPLTALLCDGDLLLTGSSNGSIIRWAGAGEGALAAAKRYPSGAADPPVAHTRAVTALALCGEGDCFVSSSVDTDKPNVVKWEVSTGRAVAVFPGMPDAVIHLATSNNTVYAGSAAGRIMGWDTETGSLLFSLTRHTRSVRSLVVAPRWPPAPTPKNDDFVLFSASADGSICAWDAYSGRPLRTMLPARGTWPRVVSSALKAVLLWVQLVEYPLSYAAPWPQLPALSMLCAVVGLRELEAFVNPFEFFLGSALESAPHSVTVYSKFALALGSVVFVAALHAANLKRALLWHASKAGSLPNASPLDRLLRAVFAALSHLFWFITVVCFMPVCEGLLGVLLLPLGAPAASEQAPACSELDESSLLSTMAGPASTLVAYTPVPSLMAALWAPLAVGVDLVAAVAGGVAARVAALPFADDPVMQCVVAAAALCAFVAIVARVVPVDGLQHIDVNTLVSWRNDFVSASTQPCHMFSVRSVGVERAMVFAKLLFTVCAVVMRDAADPGVALTALRASVFLAGAMLAGVIVAPPYYRQVVNKYVAGLLCFSLCVNAATYVVWTSDPATVATWASVLTTGQALVARNVAALTACVAFAIFAGGWLYVLARRAVFVRPPGEHAPQLIRVRSSFGGSSGMLTEAGKARHMQEVHPEHRQGRRCRRRLASWIGACWSRADEVEEGRWIAEWMARDQEFVEEVSLLRSWDAMAQEHAAYTLNRASRMIVAYSQQMVEQGAAPALVDLLKAHPTPASERRQVYALSTLANLSINLDSELASASRLRVEQGETWASVAAEVHVPVASLMVWNGASAEPKATIRAGTVVVTSPPTILLLLQHHGVVGAILSFFRRCCSGFARDKALTCIMNLAKTDDMKDALMKGGLFDSLRPIVEQAAALLEGGGEEPAEDPPTFHSLVDTAIRILTVFSYSSEAFPNRKRAVLAAGFAKPLMVMANLESSRTATGGDAAAHLHTAKAWVWTFRSLLTLGNLADHNVVEVERVWLTAELTRLGFAPIVVKHLNDESDPQRRMQERALIALEPLADSHETRVELVSLGVVSELLAVLRAHTADGHLATASLKLALVSLTHVLEDKYIQRVRYCPRVSTLTLSGTLKSLMRREGLEEDVKPLVRRALAASHEQFVATVLHSPVQRRASMRSGSFDTPGVGHLPPAVDSPPTPAPRLPSAAVTPPPALLSPPLSAAASTNMKLPPARHPSAASLGRRSSLGRQASMGRPSLEAAGRRPSLEAAGRQPSLGALGRQPSLGSLARQPSLGSLGRQPSLKLPPPRDVPPLARAHSMQAESPGSAVVDAKPPPPDEAASTALPPEPEVLHSVVAGAEAAPGTPTDTTTPTEIVEDGAGAADTANKRKADTEDVVDANDGGDGYNVNPKQRRRV